MVKPTFRDGIWTGPDDGLKYPRWLPNLVPGECWMEVTSFYQSGRSFIKMPVQD
jgi:hypothetical protein